jgi:D-beta-D-heptose 7-phosphate kinase/D-beta-D-heptose 1-phosphate adenosyltransferase
MSEYASLLQRFPATRLLVAGDVMLDRYIYGAVSRISPEAPVPVVHKTHEVAAPGGAANTAVNIAALGAKVTLLGVTGRDEAAAALCRCLEEKGVSAASLLVDATRPTTVKTRVVAHQQQVVRLDDESAAPLPAEIVDALLARFSHALAECDAVVLSDYGKGVLSSVLVPRLIELARAAGKPVLADPKTASAAPWRGVTLLKPNRIELGLLAGRPVLNHQDTLAAAALVLHELGGGALLVTEGADGMTLFEPGLALENAPRHFAAPARSVYDVTGAGDTVLATLAVAIAAGATLPIAAELGLRAAALVVQKLGTEVITLEELRG